MNNKSILVVLSLLFLIGMNVLAQEPVFSQWENSPLYLNPALTGNIDGQLRLRTQYRDQWRSIYKDAGYKTATVSADFKFRNANIRKINIGALFFRDKAGSLDFVNEGIYVSSSIFQPLGNPDNSHHSIAIGLNAGWASRKINFADAHWPGGVPPEDFRDKIGYPDVSTGLLWQYKCKTHFSYQLGMSLYHLNKPNISLFNNSLEKLSHRLNLHGNIEIPLVKSFSIVPSFLFSSQQPSEQLLFGFNNRWYPKSSSPNFVQLGIFSKTTKNYFGISDISSYTLSATVDINSILIGFSYDRFQKIESDAYEFSVGYIFGKQIINDKAGNISYAQSWPDGKYIKF